MSKATEFLKTISADEALRLRAAGKSAEETVEIAKELGYDLTPEELAAAAKELMAGTRELSMDELDAVSGGKPHEVDGIEDFFAWIACGFNHHYEYTGKTEWRLDLVFHYTYYEQKCRDCGHKSWTKTPPAETAVQQPLDDTDLSDLF